MLDPYNYVVATHVLGSDTVWSFESQIDRTQVERVAQLPPIEECNMLEVLTRLQAVMLRAPQNIDELVIVNPGFIDMETVAAAVDHVQGIVKNVKCISALHARLTASTTKVEKMPTDGHIIMVTLVDRHQEIHVLTKTRSCYHFLEHYSNPSNLDREIRRLRLAFGKAKLVLVRRKHTFPNTNAIMPGAAFNEILDFDTWHNLLALGGLTEARTKQDGKLYKIRHVAGFSIGLNLVEPDHKKVELCKYGAKVPMGIKKEFTYAVGTCKIEYDPQLVEIDLGKITRHSQLEYTMIATEKKAPMTIDLAIDILGNGAPSTRMTVTGGRCEKAPFTRCNRARIPTGFANGFIVPPPMMTHMPPPLVHSRPPGLPVPHEQPRLPSSPVPAVHSRLPGSPIPSPSVRPSFILGADSSFASSSASGTPSIHSSASSLNSVPVQTPVPSRPIPTLPIRRDSVHNQRPQVGDDFKVPDVQADFILFLADDLFSFAIKDKKTGGFTRRANVNGNFWTPMFMSFKDIGNIRLGEAALQDNKDMPDHVIHGLMSIIGKKRIEDIVCGFDWGFSIAYNEDNDIIIEFETSQGPRTMTPPMALSFHIAAALKEAKRSTNNSVPMSRVYFKTLTSPTHEMIMDIQKAANIANVTFAGIDRFTNAPVIE